MSTGGVVVDFLWWVGLGPESESGQSFVYKGTSLEPGSMWMGLALEYAVVGLGPGSVWIMVHRASQAVGMTGMAWHLDLKRLVQ